MWRGSLCLVLAVLAASCGEGGSTDAGERAVGSGGGAGGASGAAPGGSSGGVPEGQGGASGGAPAGAGGQVALFGGAPASGGHASVSDAASALCGGQLPMAHSDVPAPAMCNALPVAVTSCGEDTPIETCIEEHIVSCGPKCGCGCVTLHFDDAGCVTGFELAPGVENEAACLLELLSSERLRGPGGAGSVTLRLGACHIC